MMAKTDQDMWSNLYFHNKLVTSEGIHTFYIQVGVMLTMLVHK
jgi:hypothetical protein